MTSHPQSDDAREALSVLQAGPGPRAAGGMTRVAETIQQVTAARPDVHTRWLDSGGGRGKAGYRDFPRAVATVLRADVDVLHLHVAERGSIVRKEMLAAIARRRGIPYVVHLHGATSDQDYATLPGPLRSMADRLFRRAAGVVALGEYWRDWLVQIGVDPDRVVVVANGVPDLQGGDTRTARSVLFVGNVDARKGAASFARVAAGLVADEAVDGSWTFSLVGPHPEPEVAVEIEELARPTGGRVVLTGPQEDEALTESYRQAAIFVLPSFAEGLPMVVLEAMSAGLAIITTPVGSIPDALRDGETGLLVPPGEDDALREALLRLMGDPDLRAQLGTAARAAWQQDYSAEHSVDQLVRLWREVAASRAGDTQRTDGAA